MDIDGGIGNGVMAHHGANGGKRNLVMVHFGGKRMPEHPWSHFSTYTGLSGLIFDNALEPAV